MKAWWTYWLSVVVVAVMWLGAVVLLGRDAFRAALDDPLPATVLAAPILVAGLDLVLFRDSHETVCRLEAQRHGWLRRLVGNGYSATTFAVSGIALLALGGFVIVRAATG